MARTAWRFVDPVTSDEYSWEVNPREDGGSSHAITRNVAYEVQAGMRQTDSGVDTIDNILFETNTEQGTFNYIGYVYNPTQYDEMMSWMEKGYAFEIYDDLGRGFLIYPTSFQLKRVRSRMNPYKHDYTFNGIILEEL